MSSEDGLPLFTSYLLLTSCGLGTRDVAQNKIPDSHLYPYGAHGLLTKGVPVLPSELPVGNMKQCVPWCCSHCGGRAEALRSQSQPTEEGGKGLSSRRQEG